MKNQLFIAVMLVSACADQPDLVEETGGAGKIDATSAPSGNYKFAPTENGAANSGEILTLSLTASQTFQLTLEDELSGTQTKTGTYKLLRDAGDVNHYIDLIEGQHHERYDYSIDPVFGADQLWLHATNNAGRWYLLSRAGGDCTTSGCPSGQSCTSCWGENVCMPQGASC